MHDGEPECSNRSNKTPPVGALSRVRVAPGLLAGLRRHDFRAARTLAHMEFGGHSFVGRWGRFAGWALRPMFVTIPEAMQTAKFAGPVSRVAFWLVDENPWRNQPWENDPGARLPEQAEIVVIGAGWAGGALACSTPKTILGP